MTDRARHRRPLVPRAFIRDHHAVAHADTATRLVGHVFLVRDDDDRDSLAVEFAQHRQDLALALAVEVPRRLVGQDHTRAIDQRPGDRHALLLAAGEFIGAVVGALSQPDLLE